MPTDCSADRFAFAPVEGRAVVAGVRRRRHHLRRRDAVLGAADRAIGLVRRFAACFTDHRAADQVEHGLATLVGQRVFALALGYEDLVDHDTLRHDPVLAATMGKLAARRAGCAALAGKSTLNRLEHAPAWGADALPQDRPRRGRDRAAVRRAVPRRAQDATRGDRARPGRHRRSAARRPGGPVLPRLLWLLLLPAALRLLRRPSAGGQAAAVGQRRQRRRGGGGRAAGRRRSAPAGPTCGSFCVPIPASPARR